MNVWIKSIKRVGKITGTTFAPVQTMQMRGKELVPQTQMIPVALVALAEQLVLAPVNDLLVLWNENEVQSMADLELEVARRIDEAVAAGSSPLVTDLPSNDAEETSVAAEVDEIEDLESLIQQAKQEIAEIAEVLGDEPEEETSVE